MSVYRVARRYAEAALELGEEQKQGEQLAGDLELIGATIRESHELAALLKSPVISKEKKRAVLAALFQPKIGGLALSFLNLVLAKGREDLIADIIGEFFRLRDDRLGIIALEVRAAGELTGDQQKSIVKRFEEITQKKIRVSFSIDKQLRGGFVARVGDTVYDGSVRRQLELLRQHFAEGVGSN